MSAGPDAGVVADERARRSGAGNLDVDAIQRAHVARWADLDPAIAAPGVLPDRDRIAVRRPDGSAAFGVAAASTVDVADGRSVARALGEYALRARVVGPDVRGVFGELLGQWIAGVEAGVAPGRDAEGRPDPVFVVTWASRDAEGTAALLDRGFRPRSVLALRSGRCRAADGTSSVMGRPAPGVDVHAGSSAGARPAPSGVLIRPATASDHEAVLDAHLAEIAYDDLVGNLRLRATTRDIASVENADAIRRGAVHVAEVDGAVVGAVGINPPARSAVMSAMLAATDVSYLVVLHVRADQRGRGIGAALARVAIESAPGPVALHYSALNPLSAPFWARAGFRPVVTSWTRPVGGWS